MRVHEIGASSVCLSTWKTVGLSQMGIPFFRLKISQWGMMYLQPGWTTTTTKFYWEFDPACDFGAMHWREGSSRRKRLHLVNKRMRLEGKKRVDQIYPWKVKVRNVWVHGKSYKKWSQVHGMWVHSRILETLTFFLVSLGTCCLCLHHEK